MINKALEFIRKRIDLDFFKKDRLSAMEKRRPIFSLWEDEIYDLLEEFGEDNDLPEMWWAEYKDIDEIIDEI